MVGQNCQQEPSRHSDISFASKRKKIHILFQGHGLHSTSGQQTPPWEKNISSKRGAGPRKGDDKRRDYYKHQHYVRKYKLVIRNTKLRISSSNYAHTLRRLYCSSVMTVEERDHFSFNDTEGTGIRYFSYRLHAKSETRWQDHGYGE